MKRKGNKDNMTFQPWWEELERHLSKKLDRDNRHYFNDKREEEKKDDRKCEFPLVTVWVRHEEPPNYTCLIPLPRNYSLIAKSSTSFKFWDQENCILFISG